VHQTVQNTIIDTRSTHAAEPRYPLKFLLQQINGFDHKSFLWWPILIELFIYLFQRWGECQTSAAASTTVDDKKRLHQQHLAQRRQQHELAALQLAAATLSQENRLPYSTNSSSSCNSKLPFGRANKKPTSDSKPARSQRSSIGQEKVEQQREERASDLQSTPYHLH